ncbi:Cytochrome P450 [Parafrankia irregularis]|uniref:Cytochrome P450 n=1 Tax=Parafrankia irregularis TaxID=795642 RepID=A0A0S4QUV2_9ACTN|nr:MULTISPECIES: cytochrome P450 [Parafrankia]MBE3201533.1 cytochrome P450 [Parafrankia sp. CH37]CUU59397.1 Cytochrome P450 [Parafrankia irregularis]
MGAVSPRRRGLGDLLGDRSGWVFALLRRFRPILSAGPFTVVTRSDDVREVLGDHEHFTVAHYTPKMAEITGPFILGLDDTALYRYDHAALRAVMRRDDVPAIGHEVLAAARTRVAAAGAGELDVVRDLADPVLDGIVASYLGAPGPDTATQLRWARDLFEHIFLNASNDAAIRARALADAAEMRPHIDGLIAARKARLATDAPVPDDVLTRLLQAKEQDGGLHDLAIRHNLIGLITGWIPTVSKAFAMVVEELLRRPEELAAAQRAARAGDQQLVASYVFEALRFRPQTWALLRVCAADRVLAAGTGRETVVRAGTRVLVATRSAMFDGSVVPDAGRFRPGRAWGDYLHFGHGLHTCFGLQINRVQLPALAMALLEGGDLVRAGDLRWDGPYPASLRIRRAGRS